MARYWFTLTAFLLALAAVGCEDSSYPFTTVTESVEITYSLPETGAAELLVLNCFQNPVRTLVDGEQEVGEHSVTWDLEDDSGGYVGDGLYTVELYLNGERISVWLLEVNAQ